MADARWERIKEVFALASGAGVGERTALLERECAGDAELRKEVESLLLAQSDTLVQTGDGGRAAATLAEKHGEGPGTRIGPYRLMQRIGEGGFGTVFLAEQKTPVARKVALKIIKLGMDTRAVIARFEAERQALALMDHANIAKVFDAGATETGRPYFVMELCTGDPITEYCDKQSLGIRGRLELFAQVCQAVQHAHTKGVIHRDIKPSNVLVATQDGRPHAKVIDFGIAKATMSRLTEKTVFTEHKQLIGTPEYMSPEQAEGSLDIDTRTDVYSLGVLLYELLTGSTPFSGTDLRSAAFGELQRIIREVEPPKPSTRLSQSAETIAGVAARRQTEPKRLGTIVRGELDWIVMKALDKDRARRYESANGLATDVLRYLSGEAVVAAPPSRSYRARKFVSRHRSAVIAGMLVAAALVLGIVGTTLGLVQARRERQQAVMSRLMEAEQRKLAETRLNESQATVKFLNDMLGAADPIAQGKDVSVRSVLDRAAAELGGKFRDQPLVAARLHGTIGATYVGLGEMRAGDPHVREALTIYQKELGPEHPDTCRVANAVAVLMMKEGRLAEAEEALKKAAAEEERLFGRTHEITLEALDGLAQVYILRDRREEGAKLCREVLDARRTALGAEHQDVLSAMNTLATLDVDLGKLDEAEKLFTEAISIQDRLKGPEHPLTLQLKANFQLMLYGAAMEGKDRDSAQYQRRLALSRALGEEVLRIRTKVLGEEHPDTGTSMNNLALVYRELKLWDEADKLAARDLEVSVRKLGEGHPDTIASLANMGNSLRNRKRYDEAITYLDRALKNARKSLPTEADGLAFILGWYGSCERDLGRFVEAEKKLVEARQIIGKTKGEDHPIALQMNLGLAMLYEAWDKAEPGKGYDLKGTEWRAKAPK